MSSFTVFLKNKNFTSKIKRAKVTDYAALNTDNLLGLLLFLPTQINVCYCLSKLTRDI